MIGSPPIPMKADSPNPACTRLRQIRVPRLPLRETTPTRPGRKTSGSNAGMNPTKHSPGVTSPAVFGPATAAPFARAAASTSITSCTGTCSVRTTRRGQPASMASMAAARTPSGGMKSTETSKPSSRIASPAVAKTGAPQCSVPARFGFTPPTTFVP